MVALACLSAGLIAIGCGGSGDSQGTGPNDGQQVTIGFLYVGQTNDAGYNQASYEGSLAVARAFPEARLLQAENVPESPAAEGVMERMIRDGATIIFATSFGHLAPALAVAARHPEVTFFHEGGLETASNPGTFFGTIWEIQYLTGQAAGLATKSDRLGFVAAFPIAQSLLSVNAYQLGAQSVNPDVSTEVRFTGSWCEPGDQRRTTQALIDNGADVIGYHQDCSGPVIKTAAAAGAAVTGYHYDARDLAPDAWLTGSAWNWGPLMVDMVRMVLDGQFEGSRYAGRVRVGLRDGAVELARFGGAATPEIRTTVNRSLRAMQRGELRPFDGPVRDQQGLVRIPGRQPPTTNLEEADYLVEGVIGDLRPGK